MARNLMPQKCVCCSLETASLAVSSIGAAASLVGLVILAVLFMEPYEYSEMGSRHPETSVMVYVTLSIILAISFIVNMMLANGICKRKTSLIKPWLCLVSLFIVFGFLFMLSNSVLFPTTQVCSDYAVICVVQIVNISFFVIVYSYYEQLKLKLKYYTIVVPKILVNQ